MNLTHENYRTPENEMAFASVSQVKSFMECEAAALAELRGEFVPEEKSAFAFGELVHALALTPMDAKRTEKALARLKKSSRTYKADEENARGMVARLMRDDNCRKSLRGDCEKIIAFELFGHPFKSQIDVADTKNGLLVDLKTCRDFELKWDDVKRTKIPFYEMYNYWLQMACYCEAFKNISGGAYPDATIIVAVTKEKTPDIAIYEFADVARFQHELDIVKAYLPRLADLKAGKLTPHKCGTCDYCKSAKVCEPELAISFWN